jgi:hypothetical protein
MSCDDEMMKRWWAGGNAGFLSYGGVGTQLQSSKHHFPDQKVTPLLAGANRNIVAVVFAKLTIVVSAASFHNQIFLLLVCPVQSRVAGSAGVGV